MKKVTIEYQIDYEKYLERLFPAEVYETIAKEILGDTGLKHILFSQIGHDEEQHGRIYHVVDQYRIYDVDKKEYLHYNDERLDYGLKQLLWTCETHYTHRNDKELVAKGITWKIKTESSI